MTRIVPLLLACVLLSVCSQGGQAAPVAPLDGIGSFDCDTPGEYDLEVTGKPDSKPRDIRATDFQVIQGDPDTAYTIDPSTGTVTPDTTKRVATVYKETGAVVYRVSGEYVIKRLLPGGPPQTPQTWGATYNYGDKRLVLYVNSERPDDDFVGLTAEGTVTVTLPFADDGFTYTVQLSDGTGDGTVEFLDNASVTLGLKAGGIWEPSAVVRIRGQTAGENMIHAANTAVSAGGSLLSTPNGVDAPCPVLSLVVDSIAIKAANLQSPKAQLVVSDSSDALNLVDLGKSPEWTATDGCRAPAAFVRRKIGDPTPPPPVKLQVTFTPYIDMTVDIRAVAGLDPATDMINETFAANGTKALTFTLTEAADIGSTVGIRRWDLTWEVRPQGETEWSTVCTSTHRVFVVYDTPAAQLPLESYYYIACEAAEGEEISTSIAWKLRARFTTSARGGAPITNARRQRLGFWRPDGHQHSDELIREGSGECSAWASLFNHCLLIQGLKQMTAPTKVVKVNLDAFSSTPVGMKIIQMAVPVYNWGQPTQTEPWEYTYNVRNLPRNIVGYADWPKPPPLPECSYESCLAHDNPNARSEWTHHCIAVMRPFAGREYFFDASYGNNSVAAGLESVQEFETDMFTRAGAIVGGFSVLCPMQGAIRGRARKDPPGQQLE